MNSNGYSPGSVNSGFAAPLGAAILKSPSDPSRTPLIVEQVLGLEKRLSALHDVISNLESRMSPVLAPEPPSNQTEAKPPQYGVGLADSLMEMNTRVEYAIRRVVSVVQRAEL